MISKSVSLLVLLAMVLGFGATAATASTICGGEITYELKAGQNTDIGSVIVSNDETNLYVKYVTDAPWELREAHLFVGSSLFTERRPPGQAPYKWSGMGREHTFTVPLSELLGGVQCRATVYLQAHASVVKVENGEVVQSETAYGGDITEAGGGSWYGNIEYTIQCCVEEPPVCYATQEETAWAAGSRYVTRGNWATYTPYAEGSVQIFAGQTIPVGSAYFSSVVDGKVTITITLTDGWALNSGGETVKIQGYDAAPSGNPAPGQFTTYKGTDLTVTVDAFNFYGIHLDVAKTYEVECPA